MTKEKETPENVQESINAANQVVKEKVESSSEQHDIHEEHEDISHFSKEELLKYITNFHTTDNPSRDNTLLKDVRFHFEQYIEQEKEQALQKFIEEGGNEDDFELRKDQVMLKFEKAYEALRTKINDNFNKIEKDRERNLNIKKELLEKLRQLTSSEETTSSINTLKQIQEEWKKTGPVPTNYSQELWANYNALVEMFYNNRSIYFELKELDRKKNLESKKEIVEKAEKLAVKSNIIEAIKELKELHDEYKHLGPVPKEDQEALWQKFKAASDKVYDKRKEYYADQKKHHEENLIKKESLISKISDYAHYKTEKIDDWKAKTKEILSLQEEWRATGRIANDKAKDTSKKFWSACKAFFNNKNEFFKELEVKKEENLKLKEALVDQAVALKNNEDFRSTAAALKELQKQWEKIGPVPIKKKDEVFKKFKAACDEFFNKRRSQQAEEDREYVENLKRKNEIISKIEILAAKDSKNPEELKLLQEEWKSIGFVPKNEVKSVNDRYNDSIDKFIFGLEEKDGESKDSLQMALKLASLKGNPAVDKRIHKKEGEIAKKIHVLKKEIDQYNTNILFLSKSSKADKLKDEIHSKVVAAENELKTLESQLKQLKEA